ncbi:MAG: aconitase X catalytic domain-containing protein [Paracoccaceae bacterium]|nr:aconitase X catalytic domain-containing protein [Paracoccaceae bacterium]
MELSPADREMLAGERGEALQFAMELVVGAARILGAPRLIDAGFAHIDACHYFGRAHLDFARFFTERGARFAIPAWTNTVPVTLIGPDPREGEDPEGQAEARELTGLYAALGARPVWTCAPYQLPGGPGLGDQIIVGESNAVAYYNSVIGARTNKYGDFLDVACAMTARVPEAGLHCDEGRRAQIRFDLSEIPEEMRRTELFCHLLGYLMGRIAGTRIPAITGLPGDTPADSLKAIAAAGAASGGIALFHAVGVTPEAPDMASATGGVDPAEIVTMTREMLDQARAALSPAGEGPVSMVALGTPHFSLTELERLAGLIAGRRVADGVTLYVSTSRFVAELARQKGWLDQIEAAGGTILVDTCTYFAPPVRAAKGRVMTNSAKWAYYAPGMLPIEVAFGSLEECVESAVRGSVARSTSWN